MTEIVLHSVIISVLLIAIYIYNKNLTASLSKINEGIQAAKDGNLNHKINCVKSPQCQTIAKSLNEMFSSMKTRQYEIKAYQEELRSKNENLEAVFNSSTDGIMTLSRKLTVINVNPTMTQWIGLPSEKIIGQHFNDFFKCHCRIKMSDIDCTDSSVCPIMTNYYDEIPKEGFIVNKSNGKITYIGLNCAPIFGLAKAKESFVAVLMDITEFKELEKIKENFIATLTHDLRVPLLAESHTLKYFLKGSYGDLTEHQKIAAENMLLSNQDLLKLVNTLLDVFKYESGISQLYKEECNVKDIFNACITELCPLVEKNQQTLLCNIPENIQPIRLDKNEIKRVFMNLIGNAITYTQENGKIEIEAEQNEIETIIKVIDNGKGISEKELKNIFDRYFTSAKKFRKVGTGLGLYLSKQIILAHNGKIWVESQQGQGSTFFISLPIKAEDPEDE